MEYPEKLTMEYLIELAEERDEILRNSTITDQELEEIKMTREEYEKSLEELLNETVRYKVNDIIYDIAHERITAINKYDNYTLQRYEYPDNLDTEVIKIKKEVGYYEYF